VERDLCGADYYLIPKRSRSVSPRASSASAARSSMGDREMAGLRIAMDRPGGNDPNPYVLAAELVLDYRAVRRRRAREKPLIGLVSIIEPLYSDLIGHRFVRAA
jgi:hypothetical protein